MTKKMIVFEGVDNCGKTTLSSKLQEFYNGNDKETWIWTKEPEFSTEEADRLNSGDIDEFKREALFLESRNNRQFVYKDSNCVVDRYLWTGMAYAKVFSPNCFEFAKAIYTGPMFKKPDLYIFVDTPIEVCDQRDPTVGIDRLRKIRQAYVDTMPLLDEPIITISSVGSVEDVLKDLIKKIETHFEGK